MATVSVLGTPVLNTTSGTHSLAATPAVGDHITICLMNSGYTGSVAPTDNNADGLGTYTLAKSAVANSSAHQSEVWVRNAPIGSATSTTFTHAPGATTGGGLTVLKTTGMSLFGAASVRSTGSQDNAAGSTTPAPVLNSTPLTTNPVIGTNQSISTTGVTPRTGYTEASDLSYSTPTIGYEVMYRSSGETSATITWGGTSTAHGTIAVELNASAPSTIAPNTADSTAFLTLTPTLEFTGSDADSDDIEYEIQIDTVNTFDSSTATATPALVQDYNITNASTSPGTVAISPTTGNTIIVKANDATTSAGIISAVSDTLGNTYTKEYDYGTGGMTLTSWIATNVTGGSGTLSVTFNAAGTNLTAIAREYSGLATSGTSNGNSTGASGTSTAPTTGSLSTTNANDLLIGHFGTSTTATFTAGSGYGNTNSSGASAASFLYVEDRKVTSTGSYTAAISLGTAATWTAIVAAYKAGTTTTPLLDKLSTTDGGFLNTVNGADTHPFTAGQKASYTVQSALSAGTYYWRARSIDPSGANTYSSWSTTRSFTVSAGTANTTNFFRFF